MLLLNYPELSQFILFRERFHKNNQTIQLYCFSQYQKYLKVKYSHYGPIHFNTEVIVALLNTIILACIGLKELFNKYKKYLQKNLKDQKQNSMH